MLKKKHPNKLRKKSLFFLGALSLLTYLAVPTIFAQVQQWDFQDGENYHYDSGKLSVQAGSASLSKRPPLREEGRDAFERGDFVRDTWANRENVELIPQATDDLSRGTTAPIQVDEKTSGLAAIWHLDEPSGTNLLDTVDANVAKASDTEIVSGLAGLGYARLFDGEKSHIFIPHYSSLQLDNSFSLEAWIRPVATVSGKPQTIVSRWQTVAAQKGFALQIGTDGKLDFQVSADGATTVHHAGDTVLTPGFWYHVMATYTGDDLRVYVNGVLDSIPTPFRGPVYFSSNPVYIGALVNNRVDEFFEGVIDEVAFYNRALSETEALTHIGNTDGLVGLWKMNERGGALADRSGYSQSALPHGEPTYEAEGKLGAAVHLNGKDQYFETGASFHLSPNESLTLEGWVKPDRLPNRKDAFTIISSVGGQSSFSLSVVEDGRLQAYSPSLSPSEVYSHTTVMPNVWQHVAVTWGNGRARLYINGLLDGDNPYEGNLSVGKVGLRFGMDEQETAPFQGGLDEIAVFRRAKSTEEVAKSAGLYPSVGLYRSPIKDSGTSSPWQTLKWGEAMPYGQGISPEAKGLIHLYPFDEQIIDAKFLKDFGGDNDLNAVGTHSVPGVLSRARWFSEQAYDKVVSTKPFPKLSTFTLSTWFQFASSRPGMSDRLFSIGDEEFTVYRESSNGYITARMEGSKKLVGATSVKDTRWHHLAIVSDGRQLFLYLDGVLDGTVPVAASSPNESFVFGNLKTSDTFEGALDDFAVFNYPLEREEIIEQFLGGKLNVKFLVRSSDNDQMKDASWYGPRGRNWVEREPGAYLSGLWHFNEKRVHGKGFFVTDASRYEQHGTAYGNIQSISSGAVNGALLFNGAGDYIEIPDDEMFHLRDAFTLSAWILPKDIPSDSVKILDKRFRQGAPVFSSFALELLPHNRLAIRIGRAGGYQIIATEKDGEIGVGQWNHVAATYDGHTVKLYINGQLRKAAAISENIPYDDGALYIGRYGNGDSGYFHGGIDEVAIDNVALDEKIIQSLYLKADPTNYYVRSDVSKLDIPSARYFQYQAHLSTDYPYVTPSLNWVEVEASTYAADSPYLINNESVSFADVTSFREQLGADNQGGITYQISNDGRNWFYHNGRHWVVAASGAESNTASQIESRIREFPKEVGIGSFYFKALFHSPTGTEPVSLDGVEIEYLPNKITMLSPNGGEAWLVGSEQVVRWNSAGEIGKVRIEYSTDGFVKDFRTLAKDYPNQGSFTWQVPDAVGTQYKIRVSDALDPRIYDVTDISFRVVGAFELETPNYNERWQVGETHDIVWQTMGAIPQVKLEYSFDDFNQLIYPIIDSVKNEGAYSWKIPDHISKEVKVRVSDANDEFVSDVSNSSFTIHGKIQVLSPEVGARLLVGSEQEIRWQTVGTIPAVKIQYAHLEDHDKPEWITIEEVYSNRGSYVWRVPDEIASDVVVRVVDPNDDKVVGQSEVLSIVGGIRLLNPQGGEFWTVDSRRKISWQSIGTIPSVTLQYALLDDVSKKKLKQGLHLIQNELEWQVIAEAVPNMDSFVWKIPDAISDQVVIRVTDASDVEVFALRGYVHIVPGFSLVFPNGNEAFRVGEERNIEWKTLGSIEDVTLEYSKDNFVSDVHTIVSNAANVGRYAWTVPDDVSSQVWVRVSDPKLNQAHDISDAPFRIFGGFNIKTPLTAEKFEVGTLQTIHWDSFGTVKNVRLDYSSDDFVKDIRVITESTENTQKYDWKIPDDIGAGYSLRIQDVNDPESAVIVDGAFSIVGNFYITAPKGGDSLIVGTLTEVRWKGAASIPTIRIDYSEDDFTKSFNTIADGVPNTGSFKWEVPNRIGQAFKLRIWDPSDPASMSIMEEPSMILGGFTIESPNGGEVLYVGDKVNVIWQNYGTLPRVDISFSDDNFVSNIWKIAESYENIGRYQWTIPDVPSGSYKIRISDPIHPKAFDISNSNFRIRPRITVTSPSGGDRWAVGKKKEIKWHTSGSVAEVALEYSTDDFASVSQIAENVPNTGVYEWVVPDNVSDNLKVRVVDMRDPGALGASDAPSKIQGVLNLTSPRGGEKWLVGQSYPIDWTTVGDVKGVRLEYSRDGFKSESRVIVESMPNAGTYNWTIPDSISENVRVRVVDVSDGQVYSESSEDFQIAASFMLIGPNGGEKWHATERREISWVTVGTVPEVDLHVCRVSENGECFQDGYTIVDRGIANQGRYIWHIPRIVGARFKVRVCDATFSEVCDSSDETFSITTPFDIVNPRSRESWEVGSDREIRWHTYGDVETVKVEYATSTKPIDKNWKASEVSWKTLATELPNKGNFLFEVPDNISKYIVFRISDWLDESLYGLSKEAIKFVGSTTVLSPNGAEAWAAGTTQSIVWDTNGSITNVRIEYSKDDFNGDVRLIEAVYPNTGKYEWLVPNDLSLNAKIRIMDAGEIEVRDISDNAFKIMAGFVIHAPNGGERWTVGSTQKILWDTLGDVERVRLEYKIDDPALSLDEGWKVIKADLDNIGSYDWLIPNMVSKKLRFRIRDVADIDTYVQSQSYFEIKPDVVVTKPGAAQTLSVGVPFEVKWASIGTLGPVSILYSKDGFVADIQTIVSETEDSGSYFWTPTDDVTENATLRVVSLRDKKIKFTTQPFKILPQINVLSPRGEEKWEVGSTQKIKWDWRGSMDSVQIEYSLDNFNSSKIISEAAPNVGSFEWQVPDYVYKDLHVRVSDANHLEAFGTSLKETRIIPGFKINSPAGGERWRVGEKAWIEWNTLGSSSRIRLQYQKVSADPNVAPEWIDIGAPAKNKGRYEWTIPNDVSSRVKVRVVDITDGAAAAESNVFKILGSFQFLNPSPEEVLTVGERYALNWKTTGDIAQVGLAYAVTEDGSIPNRANFKLIEPNWENKGTYYWTVPDNMGESVWLAIWDAQEPDAYAFTPVSFKIRGRLELLLPQGKSHWKVGEVQTVKWRSVGSISHVDLYYAIGNKTSWKTIAQGITNSGSYGWQIPDAVSSDIRLRIQASNNSQINHTPDRTVTIAAQFHITNPKKTSVLTVGDEVRIAWETRGSVNKVLLEYATSEEWHLIAGPMPNSGSYTWQVPDRISSVMRIRVRDGDNVDAFDVSELFQVVGSISQVEPAGGEVFEVGSKATLKWETKGSIPEVRIELVAHDLHGTGEETSALIEERIINKGTYSWRVPEISGDTIKVRVSDVRNPAVSALSLEPFAIIGNLSLLSPKGGEDWVVGESREIVWSSKGKIKSVLLEYSRDDFYRDINIIGSDLPNTGLALWSVPDVVSSDVKVRISDFNDPRAFDVSKTPFRIRGALALTQPGVSANVWRVGEKKLISWLTTGAVSQVRIEYSRDGFAHDIHVIENAYENTGRYEWTVPDAISETLQIRVMDEKDPSVIAVSEPIAVQGDLKLTSFNQDEVLKILGRYPITWQTTGSIEKVRIEYSRDNFDTDVQVIAAEAENTGSFEWTVPDNLGSGYRLRILDAHNYSVSDLSNGYFEIQGAITLISDLSGERWAVNSTQVINWNTIGSIPNVRLDYSSDGFVRDIHLIADVVENKGKYIWTIPDDISDGIQIRIMDTRNAKVYATHDQPLSIVGTLAIVAPQGRKRAEVASPLVIQWNTMGTILNVRLEYSVAKDQESAETWRMITGSTQNTGSYTWQVPDQISDFVKIRVSDVKDANVKAVSSVPLLIVGDLDLITPQGGERWIVGTEHAIEWNTVGSVAQVDVLYSGDSFNHDIHEIAVGAPNTGKLNWVVPDQISDQMEVLVRSTRDHKVFSRTSLPFTILGDFAWVGPKQDQVWKVGREQTFQWQTIGTIPEVRLEFYVPNEDPSRSKFQVIQDRIPNEGSYSWRLPDIIGNELHVKVVDARDPSVSVVSPMNVKVEGDLKFHYPKGGERWRVGSVQKMQWSSVGTIPSVVLEYSWDGFQQVIIPMERNFKNENHYYWEIPDAVSNEVQVRLRDARDDRVFTMTEPFKIHGGLELLQPSGSQIFEVGDLRKLEWNTIGSIPSVKLEYSTDRFESEIKVIEDVTDNVGFYHWSVPDHIAKKVWVRISDARDPSIASVLRSPVQIQGALQIIHPSSRDVSTVGDTKVIRWQTNGNIPKIRLEYSSDAFSRDVQEIGEFKNTGSFEWTIPDYIHDHIMLRVSDAENPTVLGLTPVPMKIRGQLKLEVPAKDQIWKVGQEQQISWKSRGTIPQVRLEYSSDEFKDDVHVIYENIPNQGSVQWIVPDAIDENIRLRISDVRDDQVMSFSDGRVNIQGDFDWAYPTGAETWKVGKDVTVQWKTIGSIPKIALEYSTDGFQQVVRPIEKLISNKNQYVWQVPDHIHGNVQLRVRDAADVNVYAISEPFRIQGSIQVLSPQMDSVWHVGSENVIQWRSLGTIPQVRIEYSEDRFKSDVRLIDRAATATGGDVESYVWQVPDSISDQVWIRLSDARDSSVNSTTSSPFKIKGQLQVLEPRTSQVWMVGTKHQLAWKTTGSIPAVRLEYSRDAFDRDKKSIAENVENKGYFDWVVPDVVNEQIWIRVLDANDPLVWSVTPAKVRVHGRLSLDYPQGGEAWTIGEEREIKWRSNGSISQVRVEYLMPNYGSSSVNPKGDGNVKPTYIVIQDRVPNKGSYIWNIPDHLPSLIKIRIVDGHNPEVFSESENPVRLQGTLKFLNPVQKDRWVVGSTQEIVWESLGLMPQVKLEYSRDGFDKDIGVIYDLIPNAGAIKWAVPDIVTNNLQLRVSDPDNANVFDVTKQPIEVVSDFLLLTPKGGEEWVVGTDEEIRWETIGSAPYVRLEYSKDKFQSHSAIITEATPNTGRFVWTIPDDIAQDVWIRISDSSNQTVFHTADYPISLIGSLYMKKPLGGEIWTVGERKRIEWETNGTISKVRLEYSVDDFFNSVPMTGAVNNEGFLDWLVPDVITDRLRIRVLDASNSLVYADTRMPLKVQGGFSFINPKGEEFWLVGSQHAISWESFGTVPYVNVEYSSDNFLTAVPIILGTANTGSFTWMVPDITADQIKFRVSNTADQSVASVTSSPIQIGGAIKLISPAGGETWQVGETQEIRWRTTGTIPRVRIELSSDQFRNDIQAIESSQANNGFYSWKVPDFVRTGLQIRLSDVRNSKVSDKSQGPFKIIGGINIIYPEGGEVWRVGEREKMVWETIGEIPEIRLEYSTDNFVSTLPISSKVMNTGSYDWEVPDLSGRQVRFRVVDNRDPSVYAQTGYGVEILGGLDLISPKGGEVWHVGSRQPITWMTVGTIPNVNLEYSVDNFQTVHTITKALGNTGNYLWTVPSISTHNLKIRIADNTNTEIEDSTKDAIKVFGKLSIKSPRGGEQWVVGTKQSIMWTSTGDIQNVRIEYSTNNFRTTFPVVASTPNNGSYEWETPDAISKNLKLRIADVKNPSVFAQQAEGAEVLGALSLTNPTGGEMWHVGARHAISWQTYGTISQVRLEYSTDNFISDVQVISPAIANKGIYYWEVPALAAKQLKVRIVDVSNPDVYDISSDTFNIYGKINLLFPTAGELFQVGERVELQWRGTPNISNVKLEYSDDEFKTSRLISPSAPNTGSFFWNIPDEISSTIKLRISDTQNASVHATTKEPFQIRGDIDMISPRGKEVWMVGSSQTIRWQTRGTIPEVSLEYSSDDFVTSVPIALKIPNTGSYTWEVPEVFSKKMKIRVSDSKNVFVHDISPGSIDVIGNLRLLNPNGGERWIAGEERVIKWETIGHIPSVTIEYSKDNFVKDIQLIASKIPNVGSHFWRIPNDRSQNVRIRIRSSEDRQTYVESEKPFQIDYYRIRWVIRDASTRQHVTGLTLTDSAGGAQKDVGSPVTFEYPYGIFTTVWSKPGYEEVRSTWLADRDRNFEVNLVPSPKEIAAARVSFDYDETRDIVKITSWYEESGRSIPTVTKSEVRIYDGTRLIKTLTSSNPDIRGYFSMVWNTRDIQGDKRYLASSSITTSAGETITSPISYQVDLPVKEVKKINPRRSGFRPSYILGDKMESVSAPSQVKSVAKEIINPEKESLVERKSEAVIVPPKRERSFIPRKPKSAVNSKLVAPESAVLNETVSISYISEGGVSPVLDVYDGNRKLIVRGQPMKATGASGQYSYLLPVKGVGFIPGKAIKVVVIERSTGRFLSQAIQIESTASARGWDQQIGTTSVLDLVYRMDQLTTAVEKALEGKKNLSEVLVSYEGTLTELVVILNASNIDSEVLRNINDVAKKLASIIRNAGEDAEFLVRNSLKRNATVDDVSRKLRDFKSAISTLSRMQTYERAST